MLTQFLSFYGHGQVRFGSLIRQALHSIHSNERTQLCEIMNAAGSDKSREDKHNYTVLYSALFTSFKPQSVFEIGLGTNNPDLPSTMGISGKPGASLRGWREFFPDAQIYGADIDRDILFEEERIKTFYVDQLSGAAIDGMWSEFGETCDFIIDDGLHRYDANSITFRHSFPQLNSGGLYIIEDISSEVGNLAQFDQLLESTGQTAALVLLPHAINQIDNAVAVIAKD
jgi:hypothetical protein